MRIEPTQQTFGIKTQRTIRYDSPYCKRIVDTAFLDNGKSLRITKYFECDKLTQKLYYLKDQAGKWIKSKLKTYKGRTLDKIIKSENNK